MIAWEDFEKIDIRIGTILHAELNVKAKKPAYILTIDFGVAGIRKSSAQLTTLYTAQELVGKQIAAVINFPPKQIASTISTCLVLGCIGDNNAITLLQPEREVENGLSIG